MDTQSFRLNRRRVLAGAAASLALATTSRGAYADQPIRIGMISPLSGPAAPFGTEYAEGARAYVDAWNARGGFRGKPVAFDLVDDESNSVTAINNFRRFASDPATTLVWLASASSTIMAVKPLCSEYKMPTICGGVIDSIGVPPDPYLFKVVGGTSDFQKALMLWIKGKGYKRVALMHPTDGYGQAEQVTIKRLAADVGAEVVAIETYQNTDTNFTTQLVKLRASRPDIIYIASAGAPAILIYKQFLQLKIAAPIAMTQAAISRAFIEGVGGPAAIKGLHMATNLGNLGTYAGGEAARFFGEMNAALKKPGTLFTSFGWDHGILTENVLPRSDLSRTGIRNALEATRDLPAINGPFNYTPENHIGQDHRGLTMAVFDGERFVPAT